MGHFGLLETELHQQQHWEKDFYLGQGCQYKHHTSKAAINPIDLPDNNLPMRGCRSEKEGWDIDTQFTSPVYGIRVQGRGALGFQSRKSLHRS